MLTLEEDMEMHALAARGWSQAAIARHTGRDRKTVHRYLAAGEHGPARKRTASCLEPFRAYLEARFADDKHVQARVLYRELQDAGFKRSYQTLTRELRRLQLRPVCLVCAQRHGHTPTVQINHPAGEEIQWDWLELPDTPWGQPADVLVGALSHSGRFRAVLLEAMSFGYLAQGAHRILDGLGGTPRVWRTDRMATIVVPGTDRLTVDALNIAKHYGVKIVACPPRRAQRKGVVERAIQYLTGSWWRGASVKTPGEAQASLELWLTNVADQRARADGRTVGEIGAKEPLMGLPALAYPAVIVVERKTSRQALVSFDGNRYSVPPVQAGRTVTVLAKVGDPILRIASKAGEIVATHHRAPSGQGQTVQTVEHAAALEKAVLAAFTTERSCKRKHNRPPGPDALTELARLKGVDPVPAGKIVSLADYQQFAEVAGTAGAR